MAAAAGRSARLAAWGGRLRRGLAAGRRAVPSPGPVAAVVAGVALAGAGAAWQHGRVKAAAREGSLKVLAQVRDELRTAPPSDAPGREARETPDLRRARARRAPGGGRRRPRWGACGRGRGSRSSALPTWWRRGVAILGCWASPAWPGGTFVNLYC